MFRVDSFFGCVKLETFAIFIGYLGIVVNSISAVLYAIGLVVVLVKGATDLIWLPLLALLFAALGIYVFEELVEGAKTRNPKKFRKFRMVYCLGIIILAFEILSFTGEFFVLEDEKIRTRSGILALSMSFVFVWQVYVFTCINSLYLKIEDEIHHAAANAAHPDSVIAGYPNFISDDSLQSVKVQAVEPQQQIEKY